MSPAGSPGAPEGPPRAFETGVGDSFLRRWFRSLRPYSFTASIMPVLLAAAISATTPVGAEWWYLVPFAFAAVLLHAGTNVLNDYYDYLHGVDKVGDRDTSHVITQGIMPPEFMKLSGHLYFLAGIAAGSTIALTRGPFFLVAGLLGALGAYSYTNARLSLKYRALGDLAVFVLMGPALVVMGVWALEGSVASAAPLASIPVALLVTAILHGNNLRNIAEDRAAGITTLAGMLGFGLSKLLFAGLVFSAYLVTLFLVAFGTVGFGALAAFVSLPIGFSLVRTVLSADTPTPLLRLPILTARVHLIFSGFFVLGTFLGGLPGV
jgi:1,4-dihydroxy-2-naphthoate polyprenyltransferase